ncbi:MAG: DUF3046 domain-containing protein [Bifidobacteriaceae bacterium]|nr:DUF3046 domain-containing protein [Bifidobacteriaceae bacterium]
MRHSEFWESMDHAFGPAYAKSLASDLVIGALGSRTAAQALAEGHAPREVWDALCDAMEVDDAVRWRRRDARPPKRLRG